MSLTDFTHSGFPSKIVVSCVFWWGTAWRRLTFCIIVLSTNNHSRPWLGPTLWSASPTVQIFHCETGVPTSGKDINCQVVCEKKGLWADVWWTDVVLWTKWSQRKVPTTVHQLFWGWRITDWHVANGERLKNYHATKVHGYSFTWDIYNCCMIYGEKGLSIVRSIKGSL